MHLVYSIVKVRDLAEPDGPASGWLDDCGPWLGPCDYKILGFWVLLRSAPRRLAGGPGDHWGKPSPEKLAPDRIEHLPKARAHSSAVHAFGQKRGRRHLRVWIES